MDMSVQDTEKYRRTDARRVLSAGKITVLYVLFASVWILFSSYFFTFGVDDPRLNSQIETIKGILFVFLTGGLLFITLKSRQPIEIDTVDNEIANHILRTRPNTKRLGIIFTAVIIFIPVLAYSIIVTEQPRLINKTFENLSAIAELKTAQIENWIRERHSDGSTLANDPGFVNQVIQLKEKKADITRLKERLESFRSAYQYLSITIIDKTGDILLHSGVAQHVVKSNILDLLKNTSHEINHISLFRDTTHSFHINFFVPLRNRDKDSTLIGAIIMHMEPEDFLLPYIEKWPTHSNSGENIMVRQDGDDIVFLGNPSDQRGKYSKSTYSHDRDSQLSATALRNKNDGVFQGKDYRGEPVFAAYAKIDNTDWTIISKLDQAEVLEPLHTLVKWITLTSFFTLVVIALSLFLIWRQQLRIYQLGIIAERAKTDRALRHFYELPFIGMAITSPYNNRWLQFNDHLCEIFGYTRDEIVNKTWVQLLHPDDRENNIMELNQLLSGMKNGFTSETRFIKNDGATMFAVLDAKGVHDNRGNIDYIVATFQDITKRKNSEQHIKQLSRIYATLSRTNEAIVRSKTPNDLFSSVCQHAVNAGGFSIAWIGKYSRSDCK